ncbi:MAG: hypothetical protein JAY71_18785 [Candidatus Thiodiazotropha weberae]|nr:hypothetical protein [Candidatus Thiodiazotropha weberae]
MGGDDDYVEESPYERALVDMAEKRLGEYQEMYVPLEYQQMADVDRYRSNTFKQGSKDKAVNTARMQTPGTVVAGSGMDPGSGNFMVGSIGAEQQAGSAGAMGAMAGLQSAEDLYAGGTLDLAAVGRGQTGTTMNLSQSMAQQQAGVLAAQKAAQQQADSAMLGAVGSVAGAAAGAYGKEQGWFDSKKGMASKPFDPYSTGVFMDLGG